MLYSKLPVRKATSLQCGILENLYPYSLQGSKDDNKCRSLPNLI